MKVFSLLRLKEILEDFRRDNNLLLDRTQFSEAWKQYQKENGRIDYAQYFDNVEAKVEQLKVEAIQQLAPLYTTFDQDFWNNQILKLVSFKDLELNDANLTQQQLSDYASILLKNSAELYNFLMTLREISPVDGIPRSEKDIFNKNLGYIGSYLDEIEQKLSDTRQRIDKLEQESKKEQEAKSLGIGENVTLPNPCVIVYMFYTQHQNEVFSVRTGGHLAIEIIHGNERLYYSAVPGNEIPQSSSLSNSLTTVSRRMHLPRYINKQAKFNSKDQDLYLLTQSLPPQRYKRCQAVILDCSGDQPKVPLDTKKMLDTGKEYIKNVDQIDYNFWKNNCADMAMNLLAVGGINDAAKIYGLQSPPKTMSITVPLESFKFMHQLASRSEVELNQKNQLTLPEKWRNRFGQTRTNLLLAMDVSTFGSPVNEISKAQQYLKDLYCFFQQLEEKISSSEYSDIDRLEEFLKNTYAECDKRKTALVSMLSQSDIDKQEMHCYEQAMSVLTEINTKFNDHVIQFLKQSAKELIDCRLAEIAAGQFRFIPQQQNYIEVVKQAFSSFNTLSYCETDDPKIYLFMARKNIINCIKKIYNLYNAQKTQTVSQEFCKTLVSELQKMVGNINHKIFFESPSDTVSKVNSSFFTQVNNHILANKNSQGSSPITNYTDLRAEFIKSLQQKEYSRFVSIVRSDAGPLIVPKNSKGDIILPSVWKFWRRTERKELLEIKAIDHLVGLLNRGASISPQDFNGIRPEFLKEYKGRILLAKTFDYFFEGKISEERLNAQLKIYESCYTPNFKEKSVKLSETFQAISKAILKKDQDIKPLPSNSGQNSDKSMKEEEISVSSSKSTATTNKMGKPISQSPIFAFLFHNKDNEKKVTPENQAQPGCYPNI